jgi:hypothetical protein
MCLQLFGDLLHEGVRPGGRAAHRRENQRSEGAILAFLNPLLVLSVFDALVVMVVLFGRVLQVRHREMIPDSHIEEGPLSLSQEPHDRQVAAWAVIELAGLIEGLELLRF